MTERAAALADALDEVVADAIEVIEAVPPEKWTAFCEPEQCTVAALATHIGSATAGVMEVLVRPMAAGQPPLPITPEQLDAGNAQNARDHAHRPKAAVLADLRANGAAVSPAIRGLSDAQLDNSGRLFFSPEPVTVADVIQQALVDHLRGHLESLRSAVA